jgi:NADPH:quinone reductase-like Zn-dependent oxidoreductase
MLAKAAGATTIITSSSDEKLQTVKEKYGAHHCINYKKTPKWEEEVVKITNGKGVDHILEIGGSGTLVQSIAACARGGIISIIGFLEQADKSKIPDVASLALSGTVVIRGIAVGSTELLEDLVTFCRSARTETSGGQDLRVHL